MDSLSIHLVNRDGSVDKFELGAQPDMGAGLKQAREFMLVSLSAVAVDIFAGGIFVQRLGRTDGLVQRAA